MTVTHNVLVVDDHEPWRQSVRRVVGRNSRWRIVGEAADGDAAVRQAQTHKPDLILLDIGLPRINGLEAARRILSHDPGSRILFLSANRSPDVVAAALDTGARGYVLKVNARGQLLSAMETVVNGGRFVGADVAGQMVETPRERTVLEKRHEAGFYSDETFLLDAYARFAEAALAAGHALIVVTHERRREQLNGRLRGRGADVDRAISEGRYLSHLPEAVHAEFMVDGRPDEARFRKAAAALIAAASKGARGEDRRVAACGECVPALWDTRNPEVIIRLEQAWDELASAAGVDVFCGYSLNVPHLADDDYAIFQRICAEHSAIHVL